MSQIKTFFRTLYPRHIVTKVCLLVCCSLITRNFFVKMTASHVDDRGGIGDVNGNVNNLEKSALSHTRISSEMSRLNISKRRLSKSISSSSLHSVYSNSDGNLSYKKHTQKRPRKDTGVSNVQPESENTVVMISGIVQIDKYRSRLKAVQEIVKHTKIVPESISVKPNNDLWVKTKSVDDLNVLLKFKWESCFGNSASSPISTRCGIMRPSYEDRRTRVVLNDIPTMRFEDEDSPAARLIIP